LTTAEGRANIRPVTKRPKYPTVVCVCGCGRRFRPKQKHQKYLNAKHRNEHWTRLHPRVLVPIDLPTPASA